MSIGLFVKKNIVKGRTLKKKRREFHQSQLNKISEEEVWFISNKFTEYQASTVCWFEIKSSVLTKLFFLNGQYWKGTQKKGCDAASSSPHCFTREHRKIWKENGVVNQKSQ